MIQCYGVHTLEDVQGQFGPETDRSIPLDLED
jgi:hypothetical protein